MPTYVDLSSELQKLADMNVDYIIIHKDMVDSERLQRWQRALLSSPVYEDDTLAIYTTRPQADTNFTVDRELAPGLGVITSRLGKTYLGQDDVLGVDIAWGATAAPDTDYDVTLYLRSLGGKRRSAHPAPRSPTHQTSGRPYCHLSTCRGDPTDLAGDNAVSAS
jgi:hypothetical protein